uniref:Growth arrest-specific 7a n=1 Tax=Salarias fasciatus TaxID=181472 RepID=A0A672HVL5_SALFA
MEASFDTEESFDDPSCLAPPPPGAGSPARRQPHEVKETKTTINCVTFPLPEKWSYCDFFWSVPGRAGSGIKIEEYAKNLSKLSLSPLAAQEGVKAWTQLKKSLHDEAEVHLNFSNKTLFCAQLHSEVEKPLLTFRGDNFKKDLKKYDHHIADLRKQLASRYGGVEKARKALADRQKDLEVKTQQLEIKLSNKTEEDIKKARRKSTQDDLMRCVDLYNQTQSKWFEEMVTTSMELEKLEVERVEHETDMFNQSTAEPVDRLLQNVDPARDRELWVKDNKTGEVRPVDMDI